MLIGSKINDNKEDFTTRRIMHKLIILALNSCNPKIEEKSKDEKYYVKKAVKILCNLASLDKNFAFGTSQSLDKIQKLRQFASWGGLVAIYHISKFSMFPEVTKMLNTANMKALQLMESNLTLNSLKEQLGMKEKVNKDYLFPEYLMNNI